MISARFSRQTARQFWTTRVALVVGFGVSLTLLMLSGVYAIRGISQLQSSNERILAEFVGGEARLDGLRSAIYLSGTYVRDYLLEPDAGAAEQSRRALADTRLQIQSMIIPANPGPVEPGEAMYDTLRQEIAGILARARSGLELDGTAASRGRIPVSARRSVAAEIQHAEHRRHHRLGEPAAAHGTGPPAGGNVFRLAPPANAGAADSVPVWAGAGLRHGIPYSRPGRADAGSTCAR